jgi:RNA polymerase sigma-70 factor, ECF subfamily
VAPFKEHEMTTAGSPDARASFDRLMGEMRPRLHRYCARMTGSAIEGEDIVQEALMKAIEAYPAAGPIANEEAWLFRIAHNAALDHGRARARQATRHSEADLEAIADPASRTEDRAIAAAGLKTFMRLPVAQRGSVILADVLGHSVQEVAQIIASTVPAVKAALHRGRARLKEIAQEPEDRPAFALASPEHARLARYVDRFNARDFDAVRDMLADDVRLELVNRLRLAGRNEVGTYLERYAQVRDWRFVPGLVDGRAAILVVDPDDEASIAKYFILLAWQGEAVAGIRDFLFARYAIEGAEITRLG